MQHVSTSTGNLQVNSKRFFVLVYRTYKTPVRDVVCVLDCVVYVVGVVLGLCCFVALWQHCVNKTGFWWRCGWRLSVGFVCRGSIRRLSSWCSYVLSFCDGQTANRKPMRHSASYFPGFCTYVENLQGSLYYGSTRYNGFTYIKYHKDRKRQ
jgi:hypothetical protein